MALSNLSGDEQGIILGQLCSTLEPRLAMYFSSASSELRALLPPAVRQQLRADYEAAAALCLKMGMRSCKELREATSVHCEDRGLSEADLATLATLGSVLPALKKLILAERSYEIQNKWLRYVRRLYSRERSSMVFGPLPPGGGATLRAHVTVKAVPARGRFARDIDGRGLRSARVA